MRRASETRRLVRARLHQQGGPVDLTGHRFGLLTAIRITEERHRRSPVWECLCDCGETVRVSATLLGKRKSCGCLSGKRSVAEAPLPFPPSYRDPEAFQPIEEAIQLGWGDVPWPYIERVRREHGGVLPERREAA